MAKNKVKPHENSNDKLKTKTSQQLFIKNTTKFKPHKKIYKPVKSETNNVTNTSEVKSKTNVRNNQVDVLRENNDAKKPFDVKHWRLKKYSKKYKLDQWQEKQKKAVLTEYYKQVNKDNQPKFDVKKIYDQYDSDNELKEPNDAITTRSKRSKLDALKQESKEPVKQKKLSAQKMAQDEYKRILEEKKLKREERLKQNEQKKEALQKYKQNKIEKYKKLNKKTKKGQPVMRDRMQMLLEQIQSTSV